MHPELKRWFMLHAKVAAVTLVFLSVFYLFMMTLGVSLMSILLNYLMFFVGSAVFSLFFAGKVARENGITLKEGLFGAEKV